MTTATLSTVIQVYFWFGIALMVVLLGRVIILGFRHVDVQELRGQVFGGKKPTIEPSVQNKLDRGGKLYRRVMFCWFIGFILLAVGGAIFRR